MVKPRDRPSIRDRFERFHAENPAVYRLFRQFAHDAKRAGRTRFSADAILHRIRWFVSVETVGEEYKLNDHYSAMYARKLIEDEPEFAGFFELRKTRSERMLAAAQRDGRLF